ISLLPAFFFLKNKKKQKSTRLEPSYIGRKQINRPSKNGKSDNYDSYLFYKQKQFMTNRERYFFNLLYGQFSHNYFLFSQVRMVDLITPVFDKDTQYNSFIRAFRSISQYHIDFLIVSRIDFSIVCAIELDDSSHDLASRVKRDNKINLIFKFIGIPLFRSRSPLALLEMVKKHIDFQNVN
ncbi:TPA: DUF2726 domain-containing protein, partial [Escherichia coli]